MRDRDATFARGLALAALAVLAVLLIVGGWWVYRQVYFDRTPAYRASTPLFEAARTRPLTADEFDRALALCDCGERVVEYRMYAAVAVAVEKTPEYTSKAVAVFGRLAADPSDRERQVVAAAKLKRLTAPVPTPPAGRITPDTPTPPTGPPR